MYVNYQMALLTGRLLTSSIDAEGVSQAWSMRSLLKDVMRAFLYSFSYTIMITTDIITWPVLVSLSMMSLTAGMTSLPAVYMHVSHMLTM
jgi:hypothetical protein